MTLFPTFVNATKLMKPHFEKAFESLPPVTFMITDGFLSWTLDSANKYGIPRLVYYGMSAFTTALTISAASLLRTELSDDEYFQVPDFPWIKITRNDFDSPLRDRDPKGPHFDFIMESIMATSKSYGLLVNSFYELESVYVDYCNRVSSPKALCVGPFCVVHESSKEKQGISEKRSYIKWLDGMLEQGKSVLYVAFGTQAEISPEQLKEIKIGLEKSELNFLWVVRKSIDEVDDGFKNRVKNRGLMVTEWVDQREILSHGSVEGFLSHCGWNSVMESICAKVPILAWPMMADQHLNARMVVEEIKIGLKVETRDGSVRGFVKCEGLEKPIRELMEGDKGKEARKKVKEIGEAAINAVKEGGSSWQTLNELIHDLTERRQVYVSKMKNNPKFSKISTIQGAECREMASPRTIHVVVFPFMSKGHTIPIFDLARFLLCRKIYITIFTTPANRPFFSDSLSDTNINIIEIPFPQNIQGVPPGVESTDKLPSMSLFATFANATKLMKPHFEKALESLPPVTFMITDGFLGWTLDSANKFGIPRLVYFGMNEFSRVLTISTASVLRTQVSDDELFEVPDFPWIKLTRNDFDLPFRDREPKGPLFDFVKEQSMAISKSYGLLVNSFYELESVYVDCCNHISSPKSWCIGPLCAFHEPAKEQQGVTEKPSYIKWLDGMLQQGKQVLYVAFGTQAELSPEQFREIKIGLEKSQVNFLWVVRRTIDETDEEFENRVKNRGLVVTEWVDQREILSHRSVQGFLSHCGWNSVMESICAKVPILAWPMMADQHLNARMVVEVIKIGLRVETCDGSVRGFVKWEGLEKSAKELMEGDKGKEARKKVKEIGEAAINSVKEGGSSWQTLNELIVELTEISV